MQRAPTRTRRDFRAVVAPPDHSISAPVAGTSSNTGPMASAAWLTTMALVPSEARWFVELVFSAHESEDTRFQLDIYSEEWGFMFAHAGEASWIRVTDIRFVHGLDEHKLLRETPPLREIGRLLRTLEARHRIHLRRETARVQTSLPGADSLIRAWASSL